jgi:hypothetical protein
MPSTRATSALFPTALEDALHIDTFQFVERLRRWSAF